MSQGGTAVRPVDEIARGVRAQAVRPGSNPDPAQIEAVRVPAGEHGRVAGRQTVGVEAAGLVQQLEAGVIQMDERPPRRDRAKSPPRRPWSVRGAR